jgi:hypothetical protein
MTSPSPKEPSILESISEVLDQALGIKKPEDLQRYVNGFLAVLVAVALWLMATRPEARLLISGFLLLILGLGASVAWVVVEARRLSRQD